MKSKTGGSSRMFNGDDNDDEEKEEREGIDMDKDAM